MTMNFEQKLHTLQLEADGFAAIMGAIDNTIQDFDENQTIAAIAVLYKLAKGHADNIQTAIGMFERDGGDSA